MCKRTKNLIYQYERIYELDNYVLNIDKPPIMAVMYFCRSMALSKLLQHAINTNDSRLQDIYLKEEVISQSNVIRTRAKAKSTVIIFFNLNSQSEASFVSFIYVRL